MNLSFLIEIAKFVCAIFISWVVLELGGFFVSYNALFPTWAMALVSGVGMMLIAIAYRRERKLLSRNRGIWLVSLRCFSFAVVALMLMQPVLQRTLSRKVERTVAVMVDASDSMRFQDDCWTPSEALSLAYEAGIVQRDKKPLPSLEPLESLSERMKPWLSSSLDGGRLPPAYRKLISQSRSEAGRLLSELDSESLAGSTNAVLASFRNHLENVLLPSLDSLKKSGNNQAAAGAFERFSSQVAAVRTIADRIFWESIPSNRVEEIKLFANRSRLEHSIGILTNSLESLSDDYGVKYFSLGKSLVPTSIDVLSNGLRDNDHALATDFGAALEDVVAKVPSEELAGVLLLSDGLDNGEASVEPVARRLGGRGVKVSSVLVGSSTPPRDIAIADIDAPESIFLGDKVRVRSRISAMQARGTNATVSLLLDGIVVDEQKIPISEDLFSREFSLSHAPTNNGLARYQLRIDEIDGERFSSNNVWSVDVAVSDDRTNVLLIDDYPRWDFRYLRNLFYARDKSVHLQYYLVHPDTVVGLDVTNRLPMASASRPFGEAEAGGLPVNAEEWRKFDTIILGDVGPEVITPEIQKIIVECVEERGTLLISIAGPRAMPHRYPDGSPLRQLLPGLFKTPDKGADFWKGCETSYRVELTPSGRLHPVMQQSTSPTENEQVWSSLPDFVWRFPISDIKSGAEIIAVAGVKNEAKEDSAVTAENVAILMEKERLERIERALVVAHNAGRGKVLQLNTDESWRLRYRVGDTRHHRFWGQIIRWGLGERLRSGTPRLRVGTERLTYTPHDTVRLLARVLDERLAPVSNATVVAVVSSLASNSAVKVRVPLSYVANTQGLYEGVLQSIGEPGAYEVAIEEPWHLSGETDKERKVSTTFFVAALRRPMEMAYVGADSDKLELLARWTGGRTVAPAEARDLLGSFGEKSRVVTEPIEIVLWDEPLLFLLLAVSLTVEWILRKRGGLV